ncbi:MAG: hypothetical protein IPF92_01755 [Myxococcales bacterium]|jgi:tellurite resistance protein|nr:hypothetical protein [Myxococcales bacterium]MBL0193855.1 hypothetical protein [Myxococcales bacterium]HQY63413.1 hypothetical protein [Polyangiaceae bacterium]
MSFDVERVLGTETFTPAEAEAMLEIAYLTGAANGSLSRDELRSFRRLAHTLADRTEHDTPAPGKLNVEHAVPPLEELLEKYEAASEGVELSVRLAQLAKVLDRDEARRAAYRAAYALAISDLESNEHEEELEADLATALGLLDEVQELRNSVLGAVDGEPIE